MLFLWLSSPQARRVMEWVAAGTPEAIVVWTSLTEHNAAIAHALRRLGDQLQVTHIQVNGSHIVG